MRQVKEKYELTSFLKVYGGFTPQRDGERVTVKIKSRYRWLSCFFPLDIADQLHRRPGALETALEKSACQQRNVQSLQFQCTFNASDGDHRSWLDRNPAAGTSTKIPQGSCPCCKRHFIGTFP